MTGRITGRFSRRFAGFTLLELLIVVAIFSIIMSLAVAGYRQYIIRANRVDATVLLLRVAAAQERHYLAQNTYTADLVALGFPDAGSERGYYTLTVSPALAGLATGFTATAKVAAGESQSGDEQCQELSINESGLRSSAPEGPDVCWD
jgi:type IV pilus assembly protein PilE